jgi:starch synthase
LFAAVARVTLPIPVADFPVALQLAGRVLNIVMASSEAVPFAKSGGLADVVSGLSRALSAAGHQLTVILPYHRRFISSSLAGEPTGQSVSVTLGRHTAQAWIRRSHIPDSQVQALLVDHPGYFDRVGLYGHEGTDFPDNAERFVFLSRAALEVCAAFDLRPDIIHVHDWQTALMPILLREQYRHRSGLESTATVLTLHNMAFQGNFPSTAMALTGLRQELFTWEQLEFWGNLNLLKSGCVFADKITTVSPTYAREITTTEFGSGLEGVLRYRGKDVVGILNGVDLEHWHPSRDSHIAVHYDVDSVERGKSVCKRELQRELGLSVEEHTPLCGMVSRLTEQKGLDLIAATSAQLLQSEAQIVFLGSGDQKFEDMIRWLAQRAPGRIAAVVGYNEPLAHRVEAGSDLFLMPSRFEPCGLNQMYSLIYGTVPLVHAVGGLADSVTNLTPLSIADGRANGFAFYDYTPDAFLGTFRWALNTYRDRDTWRELQRNGMSIDHSWAHSAGEYVEVYESAREAVSGRG